MNRKGKDMPYAMMDQYHVQRKEDDSITTQ